MNQEKPLVGLPADSGRATWVQTERRAHEAWARLTSKNPRAAGLMHELVARMGPQNAVVVSQKTLGKLMGCSVETIKRAVKVLASDRWIQVVAMNGPGTVSAYVVNSRVAFAERRDTLHMALFTATIVADAADQNAETLASTELFKIPMLFPGEMQLPTGPGEEPPAEPALDGLEHDLPALADNRQASLI